MIRDYFTHIDENLVITTDLTYNGQPMDLTNHRVEFAASFDQTSNAISVLTLSDGITIENANTATVVVNFKPSANLGYTTRDLMYQLRTVDESTDFVKIHLEGRIFTSPSLFTD